LQLLLRRIKATNFKSFENLELELDSFNILIGGNASGKSNFVQMLKFLSDISKDGLQNAISEQGDIYYASNVKIGSQRDMEFHLKFDVKDTPSQYYVSTKFAELLQMISIDYNFSLRNYVIKKEQECQGGMIFDK
jgi:predicted ATPase